MDLILNFWDSFPQHRPGSDQPPFVVIPFPFAFEMQSEARKALKYRLRKSWVDEFSALREWVQVPMQTKLIDFNNL